MGRPAAGSALAALAGRQHGVVSVAQLRALGLDHSAVGRRVAAGRLHPLHRGVYAVGHRALTPHGRFLAAVLAGGPDALLSHRSAASLWGLRPPTTRLEVTVPRGRAGARRIEVHRSRSIHSEEFAVRDAIPVTSVARTLLNLAGVVSAQALARALDRAERLGLFDLELTRDAITRARGRRGTALLRSAIADWQPRQTLSELEDRFQDLLSQAAVFPPRASTRS